jgi:predicted ATPase/class 3 adenylate cyclase
MPDLPTGIVTFLFTDLEGSTRLWEEHPEAMKSALARHNEILRDAISAHAGHVVKSTGDGFHVVFTTAADAVAAAGRAQVALHEEVWGATGPLRVRMGLHTCEAELREGDYFGTAVNRAARLMSIAHGGQVVLSSATAEVVVEAGLDLQDLGEHRLAGLSRPERVWQLCPPGLDREFPPLRSLDVLPGNLPRQVTSFVGRDREVAEIAALVGSRPLVTLTGVGGVGKTRLALEVAAEVVGDFPDGAWLCELAPLTDPDAIWETVASAFRVLPMPGRSLDEVVVEYLGSKLLLLVLDNCEHLLDAVANLVVAVERSCTGVTVLATSREGLAVAGEQIVAVPSLGVPPGDAPSAVIADSEAVVLFSDRARSARSDFTLTDGNANAVGVLCRRLDGIPLAIELAAARVRSLTPEDIVNRLDQRFKLLTRGSRASLERHQTLRNTIDWSYELLEDRERQALNRLSVFAGGCDLAAAEAVLGGEDLDPLDVVDVLGQLVDKSLVVADPDEDGHLRYRLLETIRQYAQEQLETSGDAPAIRRRHADHFVAVADVAGPRLRSRDDLTWARIMARETDNLRAVADWAAETPSLDHAMRLVAPLAVSGVPIGFSAMDWAESAVAISDAEDHPLFTDVASWATWSATMRSDFDTAGPLARRIEAVEAARGIRSPPACQGPATLAFFRGDLDEARQRAEEWVMRARASGDSYEIATALMMLTGAQFVLGDTVQGQANVEEAVQVAREAGIRSALSQALALLTMFARLDESERMLSLLDEAVEVGTEIGNHIAVFQARSSKVGALAYLGQSIEALDFARDTAEQMAQTTTPTIWGLYDTAAVALQDLGHPEPAAVLFGAGRHFAQGVLPDEIEELRAARERELLAELGQSQFDSLTAQGGGYTQADATAYLIEAARNATSAVE